MDGRDDSDLAACVYALGGHGLFEKGDAVGEPESFGQARGSEDLGSIDDIPIFSQES